MASNNTQLLFHAEDLAERGDLAGARRLVDQAIANNRNDPEAWWSLVQLAHNDAERRRALDYVLALNPHHLHAQHMRDQLNAGTAPAIARELQRDFSEALWGGGKEKAHTIGRNYLLPAVGTLIAYWVFWLAGFLANLYFLWEARRTFQTTGHRQQNVGCLWAMIWVQVGGVFLFCLLVVYFLFDAL